MKKSVSMFYVTEETSIEQTVFEMNQQRIVSVGRDSKTIQLSMVMTECIQRNLPYRIPV